jgi:hypothetical protein
MGEAKRRKALFADRALQPEMVAVGEHLMVAKQHAKFYQEAIEDLMRRAIDIQAPGLVFPKLDAALHEASHCVVARREGRAIKAASIWQEVDGNWVGKFAIDDDGLIQIDLMDWRELFPHIRILLAGRRGELLFAPKFSVWSGLDELAWCLLHVMAPIAKSFRAEDYCNIWGTILSETDETLRRHEGVVRAITGELERSGSVDREWLQAALESIPPRTEQPPALGVITRMQPGDPLI